MSSLSKEIRSRDSYSVVTQSVMTVSHDFLCMAGQSAAHSTDKSPNLGTLECGV